VIGAATALMAGTIAIVQTDIKRVLAYSTVSQLGFMFLAAGMGAFGVAVFHLYTHAFFKALLFLGSGSVIHAMSGEQDMRRMGGLRTRIPWTFGTFLVGTLAIAGIPPLAGFFSKDEILASALHHPVLFGVMLFTALLTAAYMARLLFLTFFGSFRGSHEAEHHLHESPWSMLGPLVVLAVGSAVAGFVKVPQLVQPVFRLPEPHVAHAGWLPLVATAAGVLGILIAYYLYLGMPELRGSLARPLRPLLALFGAKYFFDHVYDGFVSRVVVRGSDALLWKRVDAGLIDGLVNWSGRAVRAVAETLRPVQTGFVRHYALLVLAGAVAIVSYLLAALERVRP
jgi:NADH-quinone oxidoreductase subunit L